MPRSFDPARSLTARFPTLAAQWHPTRNVPLTPDNVLASSPTSIWWQCAAGHEWEDKVATRTALPKWKKGDIAACPECVDSPTRLVSHTYADCGHTRTVQRRNVEKDQQRCWECGGDLDSAKEGTKLERDRLNALESYRRCKERGVRLSARQRAAQRSLVGFINVASVEATRAGVTWWRDSDTVDMCGTTSTEALSEWMSILAIPHLIVLRQSSRRRVQAGVHLANSDLDRLGEWAPTFASKIRVFLSEI